VSETIRTCNSLLNNVMDTLGAQPTVRKTPTKMNSRNRKQRRKMKNSYASSKIGKDEKISKFDLKEHMGDEDMARIREDLAATTVMSEDIKKEQGELHSVKEQVNQMEAMLAAMAKNHGRSSVVDGKELGTPRSGRYSCVTYNSDQYEEGEASPHSLVSDAAVISGQGEPAAGSKGSSSPNHLTVDT